MDVIDFRSDTVTWPTPAMREAMAKAPVGDDVFGDDPTVLELEAEAAAMLGKEAGLFVPSGTMGNLVSTLTHCGRGDEMIVGRQAHIITSEIGSHAAYGAIQPYILDVGADGTLDLDQIRAAIHLPHQYAPTTRLICLENTQGGVGGIPITADYTNQVVAIAREYNLKLHVDGARIFNAAAALNTPARDLVAGADSVMFCLSKGLCAPIGSVIVGSREFIKRAHRVRKSLGGGMRQVGIVAAAGLIALREMTTRLHEDHANARALADGLATVPGVQVERERVQTNMVFFTLAEDAPLTPAQLIEHMEREHRIRLYCMNHAQRLFRLVTHYYIRREHVDTTVQALRAALTETAAPANR